MKEWLESIQRKAWWLIFWSALYVILALGYLGYEYEAGLLFGNHSRFNDYLMYGQMVWLVIMGSPLIPGTRLNQWVFKRD